MTTAAVKKIARNNRRTYRALNKSIRKCQAANVRIDTTIVKYSHLTVR